MFGERGQGRFELHDKSTFDIIGRDRESVGRVGPTVIATFGGASRLTFSA